MKTMIKTLKMLMLAILVCFTLTVPAAMAEDVILDTKIDSVTSALDKNGAPYIRVIVTESRSLKGIAYEATVPVMFFGSTVSQAKVLVEGDNVRILANKRMYQGNASYTARKILPKS
jgi:hypothetical protein